MTAQARYLDDFVAGPVYELGSHAVSFDEIVRYARKWDPRASTPIPPRLPTAATVA